MSYGNIGQSRIFPCVEYPPKLSHAWTSPVLCRECLWTAWTADPSPRCPRYVSRWFAQSPMNQRSTGIGLHLIFLLIGLVKSMQRHLQTNNNSFKTKSTARLNKSLYETQSSCPLATYCKCNGFTYLLSCAWVAGTPFSHMCGRSTARSPKAAVCLPSPHRHY